MLDFHDNGLEFPLPFALKVIGRDENDFFGHAVAIFRTYFPELDETAITVQPSTANTYISITIPFVAESREQLDAIYQDLKNSERVLMVI